MIILVNIATIWGEIFLFSPFSFSCASITLRPLAFWEMSFVSGICCCGTLSNWLNITLSCKMQIHNTWILVKRIFSLHCLLCNKYCTHSHCTNDIFSIYIVHTYIVKKRYRWLWALVEMQRFQAFFDCYFDQSPCFFQVLQHKKQKNFVRSLIRVDPWEKKTNILKWCLKQHYILRLLKMNMLVFCQLNHNSVIDHFCSV